jgi:hypothetical protein
MQSPSPTKDVAARTERPDLTPRVALIALLAPTVLMLWSAYAMWVTYSPTPYVDQWVDAYRWAAAGKSGWLAYLLSQNNEHRIFFPRLVFSADYQWFQGRDILNLVAVGLTQLLGAALFVRLAQVRRAGALGLLGLATALSLVFSLMQWETFTWGFELQIVGVYASAAWALYAFCLASRDPKGLRPGWMAAAIALLVVAAFNSANGMFAGVAMLLVALVTGRGLKAAALAGIATVVLLVVYLLGYTAPHGSADPSWFVHHPGRVATYLASYLGAVWWPDETPLAAVVGLAGAVATAGMILVVARDRRRDPAAAALLGIVLFVGLSVLLTALGRGPKGLWTAFSSRYMTATAYFWAAHAVFWARGALRGSSRTARVALGAVLAVAILRLVALQSAGYRQALAAHEGVLLGSSALLGGVGDGVALLNVVGISAAEKILDEDVPLLRARRMGLFADPPVATLGATFSAPRAAPGACRGAFNALAPAPDLFGRPTPPGGAQVLRAGGWGWDAQARKRFAHVVLVDGADRVVGIGLSGVRSADAVRGTGSDPTAGWIAAMARGAGREVTAYGVTAAGSACELGRKPWPQ